MAMNPDLVNQLYEKAVEEALRQVEAEARRILRRNQSMHEFVMAMGTFFFVTKKGDHCRDDDPRFDELSDFIGKWDNYLKLTGTPMRFTAYGPTITDW